MTMILNLYLNRTLNRSLNQNLSLKEEIMDRREMKDIVFYNKILTYEQF